MVFYCFNFVQNLWFKFVGLCVMDILVLVYTASRVQAEDAVNLSNDPQNRNTSQHKPYGLGVFLQVKVTGWMDATRYHRRPDYLGIRFPPLKFVLLSIMQGWQLHCRHFIQSTCGIFLLAVWDVCCSSFFLIDFVQDFASGYLRSGEQAQHTK